MGGLPSTRPKWKKAITYLVIAAFVMVLLPSILVRADTTSTLRPTADGGDDSADWDNTGGTACNATDCYTEVDESSGASCTNSDGDTTYIVTSTNGADQTFNIDLSSITNNSTITQIDITVCAVRGAGGAKIQTRRCVDGTCTNSGTDINLGASYSETTQSHTGLSITKGVSTDFEIGISNEAAKSAKLSQISAVITYTLPDTTAPDAVTDLAAGSATATTIVLSWTAPGDDGSTGTATTYDIRYSTATITDGNWSSATTITGEPTPSVAGSSESHTVTGLSEETTYYFAIKTSDEVPNEAGISNVPSLATTSTADTTAPDAVTNLAASGPTTSAINLTWTAPGDDGSTGTATSYDIRYSNSEIFESNWSSATTVTGEPTPAVAGSSESHMVSGLTDDTTYYFALKTTDEAANESGISNSLSETTTAAPSIIIPTGGGGVSPTTARFSGQAFPGGSIEVLQKSTTDSYTHVPIENIVIADDGTFLIEYIALLQGEYFFALRAQDRDGRKTGIISFNANLRTSSLIEATNIFVPPTLSFASQTVSVNSEVVAVGYAAPQSVIGYEIDGEAVGEGVANADGYHTLSYDISGYTLGDHSMRARQSDAVADEDQRISNFSFLQTFKISTLVYPAADFNNDSKVNITDWSIFLFRWGSEEDDLHNDVDLDKNGIIDIADFSIFLKAMTI